MSQILEEMEEYARFPLDTRRYIVRALDFGLQRGDYIARWTGSFFDTPTHLARADIYSGIKPARLLLNGGPIPIGVEDLARHCSKFDLQFPEMHSFPAFRFLYERLFGPHIRPHLASLYSSAATSPNLTSEGRTQALAGISMFEQVEENLGNEVPQFYPEWDGD